MAVRALVRLVVCSAALAVISGCGRDDSPASPTAPGPPPAVSTPVYYSAIGASDAIGFGSSRPCLPFVPCPEGNGYVQIIARQLAPGRTFTQTNLGIPGAVLGPETQALGRRYGRDLGYNFLENEVPFIPRETTLVTVFAGGNDANAIVAAAEAGAAGSNVSGFLDQQVRQFADDMSRLVREVRGRSSSARIVVANLPNLALLPYATGYGADRRQWLRQLSAGFSTQGVNPLTGQGVVVIDLMCDGRTYDRGLYFSDGFHPNDSGYQFIADRFLSAINGASASPPRSSCPEMAAF